LSMKTGAWNGDHSYLLSTDAVLIQIDISQSVTSTDKVRYIMDIFLSL